LILREISINKIRVGFIGAGFIADTLANALLKLKEYSSIEAVYSREIEKAKHFAKRFGVEKIYSSWRDLINDNEIEAIVVATPTYTHKEIAVEAAKRGKHVFLEKPISLNIQDAREIVREAEKNHIKLFVGHCLRYWPEYVRVKELVSRGEIGEPRVARAYRLGSYPTWSLWYRYREFSGGVVIDLAIHDIDFLRWVMGSVKRVYGVGGRFSRYSIDVIDHAMYILEFENGAVAYGEASWAMPQKFGFTTYLEIAGTKGLLTVDNKSTASVHEYYNDSSSSYSPLYHDAYYNELKAFLRWILFNESVAISPEDAVESLRIALAVTKSIEKREAIDLGVEAA